MKIRAKNVIFLEFPRFLCYNITMKRDIVTPRLEHETIESLQVRLSDIATQMAKMEALLQYDEAQFRLLKRR